MGKNLKHISHWETVILITDYNRNSLQDSHSHSLENVKIKLFSKKSEHLGSIILVRITVISISIT